MNSKLKVIIPSAIAVIAIILAAVCIKFTPSETADISSLVSTAQKYLIENNYEQAIAEFEKIIDLDPRNADAYIGIAEAYEEMGDTEKAIEWLEKGYELTEDERIFEMLERLKQTEETEVVTESTTSETVATTAALKMFTVPDLSGLSEEEAIAACEAAGISYEIITEESENIEKGYVISQGIPANSKVDENAEIIFVVSKGKKEVTTTATTVETTETTIEMTVTSTEITTETTTVPQEEYITINGKQYSTAITELDLSMTSITDSDLENLCYMKKLKKLNLSKVNYTKYDSNNNGSHSWDFSPLSNIPNLQELNISYNHIGDSQFKTLKNLPKLKKLEVAMDVFWGNIRDISPITEFTELEYLDISGNNFDDLSPLSKLTKLTYLDVNTTANWKEYRDLTPLSELTNLTYLNLSLCNIKDISPLSVLVNLEELYIDMNDIEDLTPLENLKKLKQVGLSSNDFDNDEIDNLKKALPDCKTAY